MHRSDGHSPEGLLSIEGTDTNDGINPCFTNVKRISGKSSLPIKVPLNAVTQVEITGNGLSPWMNEPQV